MQKRVLIIGAGAIGQVYGAHLAEADADVGVFIRPKYVSNAIDGYRLHQLRSMRSPRTYRYHAGTVSTCLETSLREEHDYILLAIPSDSLDDALLETIGGGIKDSRIVSLQPGLQSISKLTQFVPRESIITGTIGFIAYQAPLAGEALEPGVAYYFPPLVKSVFSGEGADEFVALLNRGGLPAKKIDDARRTLMNSSAILMPHIAALEAAEWSFDRLLEGDLLALASLGSKEALRACESFDGGDTSIQRQLLRPALIRAALRSGSRVLPFDLEAYLAAHFQKVRPQSRLLLREYIDLAHSNNEGRALEALQARVLALPAEAE